jgi:DhnA family fructose-bisphosphate aldolase class Ia
MPVTGESIRFSRLFSEGKNAVIVAVDHGLYFGPLQGMINLSTVIDTVAGADAILMAPGTPAHCQSVFSKRGAPACIIRLNWGSNYAAMWNYKHSHSVPMLSVADAVAQGADLVIGSLSLKNPDEAEDAHNVEVFSQCVAQARSLGIPLIGEVYPTGLCGLPYHRRVGRRPGQDLLYRQAFQRDHRGYTRPGPGPGRKETPQGKRCPQAGGRFG